MRLETFSYLPALSGEQLERQVRAILDRGLVISIEYTTAPDPRDHYWAMWKLPFFGSAGPVGPASVLADLDACRQANPDAFIKVNGYDRTRQGQVVSFVASRPAEEDWCRARSC